LLFIYQLRRFIYVSENEYCLMYILLDAVVFVPSLVVMESGNYSHKCMRLQYWKLSQKDSSGWFSCKLTFSLNLVLVLQFVLAPVLVLWYSNNGETDMFLLYLFWCVNGFGKFAYGELLITTTYINFRLAMLSGVKSPSN
jgi:hypothetical protein